MKYSISKGAEKAGVSKYTIRYYEKIGLLPKISRADNKLLNYRIIDDHVIKRIKRIKWFQTLGLRLTEISSILTYEEEADEHLFDEIRAIFNRRKKELEIEKIVLDERIDSLKSVCDQLAIRKGDINPSTYDMK